MRLNQQTTDELLELHRVAIANEWTEVAYSVLDVLQHREYRRVDRLGDGR